MRCPNCGIGIDHIQVWPLHCGCGHRVDNVSVADQSETPAPLEQRLPKEQVKQRRRICFRCDNYLPAENGCGLLPEGRRNIDGRKGCPNPDARCPDGKWDQVSNL